MAGSYRLSALGLVWKLVADGRTLTAL